MVTEGAGSPAGDASGTRPAPMPYPANPTVPARRMREALRGPSAMPRETAASMSGIECPSASIALPRGGPSSGQPQQPALQGALDLAAVQHSRRIEELIAARRSRGDSNLNAAEVHVEGVRTRGREARGVSRHDKRPEGPGAGPTTGEPAEALRARPASPDFRRTRKRTLEAGKSAEGGVASGSDMNDSSASRQGKKQRSSESEDPFLLSQRQAQYLHQLSRAIQLMIGSTKPQAAASAASVFPTSAAATAPTMFPGMHASSPNSLSSLPSFPSVPQAHPLRQQQQQPFQPQILLPSQQLHPSEQQGMPQYPHEFHLPQYQPQQQVRQPSFMTQQQRQ